MPDLNISLDEKDIAPAPLNIPSPTTDHTIGSGVVPIDAIKWGSRMRSVSPIVLKHIEDLAISIAEKGLIQTIVVNILPDGTVEGIAGWCRTQAFKLLGHTTIPYSERRSLPPDRQLELELDENLHRLEMTWQENCIGIYRIHQKKILLDSSTQWGQAETGKLLGVSRAHVGECLVVAKELLRGNTELNTATSVKDAMKVLLKQKETTVVQALASMNSGIKHISTVGPLNRISGPIGPVDPLSLDLLGSTPPSGIVRSAGIVGSLAELDTTVVDLSKMLIHASCHDVMADMEKESVDVIVTDIPYGIDMENLEEIEGVEIVENSHDVQENIDQFEKFLNGAFRVLKDKSYLLFFYDLCHHEKIINFGRDAGFNVQPYPLLWLKPTARNRAAHCHWPKCHETVAVMRKGAANLRSPMPVNYFMCDGRAEKKLQRNPFSKPFEFLKWMMTPVVVPGMTMLDPYAGGGSIVRAALNMGLKPIGVEKDDTQFPHLLENIKQTILGMTKGPVQFKI